MHLLSKTVILHIGQNYGGRAVNGTRRKMKRKVTKPRPGHADLNGAIKYGHRDMRNVLERSSARETTVRVVAAGAVAKKVLAELGITVAGHVIEIGGVQAKETTYRSIEELKVLQKHHLSVV